MIRFRVFNDARRYEYEQATRLMPQDLAKGCDYTFRLRWPVGSTLAFGAEYIVEVGRTARVAEHWQVELLGWWRRPEVSSLDCIFDQDGYYLANYRDATLERMGYIVGSTDPVDLAAAHLSTTFTRSRELTSV